MPVTATCRPQRAICAGDRVPADASARASVIPIRADGRGTPLFFVHCVTPRPWMVRLLGPVLQLTRPTYGTRSPELDSGRDVMTIEELAAHYATEIRRVQPEGPYSLMGFSFGGILAFETALRLRQQGQVVERLVLLETSAPVRSMRWWRATILLTVIDALRMLARLDLMPHALVRRLTVRRTPIGKLVTPIGRLRLALGAGPLTVRELRTILAVAFPGRTYRRTRGLTFEALCALVAAELKRASTERQWQTLVRRAGSDAPLALIKAQKLTVKNTRLIQYYRPRSVYDGPITIYARAENPGAAGAWQRFTSQPLDIRLVPIAVEPGGDAHRAFVAPDGVQIYAADLRRLLESGSAC